MALIKKDYGLIYNDDGSLCTTVRKDDVPFPGVSSFAVEEGTENLANNSIVNYNGSVYTRELVTSGEFTGWYKVHVTHTGSPSYAAHLYAYPVPDGSTNTWSLDFYSPSGKFTLRLTGYHGVGTFVQKSIYRWVRTWTNDLGQTATEGVYFLGNYPADTDIDDYFYYRRYQIEAKPFATSFVDGTRPAGKFTLFDDVTVRNWNNTGVVISAWYKRESSLELTVESRMFSTTQTGGINIEHRSNQSNWEVLIYFNSAYHTYNIVPYDYFNDLQWHQVTLIYGNDYSLKVFVDGIKKVDVNLGYPIGWDSSTQYALGIGYEYYDNNCWWNGLISNLLVAKYNPDFWTDEYIKYIYEQRIPFNIRTSFPLK